MSYVSNNFPLLGTKTRFPLMGLSVLLVEDSHATGEAIRLFCARLGARIQWANCIESARRLMRDYRPSFVLIDIGLPDGSGAELITYAVRVMPPQTIVLGISADLDGKQIAMDAGAAGFIEKPILSMAAFQATLISAMPRQKHPRALHTGRSTPITPDNEALHDDLEYAFSLLKDGDKGVETKAYFVQFLRGIVRMTHDKVLNIKLEAYAQAREREYPKARQALMDVLTERLDALLLMQNPYKGRATPSHKHLFADIGA